MFLGSFVRFLCDLLSLLRLASDLLGSLCNLLVCHLGLLVFFWLCVIVLACAAVHHWVELWSVLTTAPWWVVPVLTAAVSVRVAKISGVTFTWIAWLQVCTSTAVDHWVEVSSVVATAPWWVVPVQIAAVSVRVAKISGVTFTFNAWFHWSHAWTSTAVDHWVEVSSVLTTAPLWMC